MVTRARKAREFFAGWGSALIALWRIAAAACGCGMQKSRSLMTAGSENGADDGSRTQIRTSKALIYKEKFEAFGNPFVKCYRSQDFFSMSCTASMPG